MSTFSVSFTFVANTKAKASEVNQNFTDVLNILKAHHHDPNIYPTASQITNSGIADNAQIRDTQLMSPITRSGLNHPSSLQVVTVPKGGTGHAGFATGDILYAQNSTTLARLPAGSEGLVLAVKSGVPAWDSSPSMPTGSVVMWSTTSAPSGWLLCDGSAVSRTTYASLFAVIGTTFGAGDGSTTFNVPNFKGRMPVGYNSAETEFDAIGETGGEKTHTLTAAEMPAHTHSIPSIVASVVNGGGTRTSNNDATNGQDSIDTGSAGSGDPHNNLPPYLSLPFIIKT